MQLMETFKPLGDQYATCWPRIAGPQGSFRRSPSCTCGQDLRQMKLLTTVAFEELLTRCCSLVIAATDLWEQTCGIEKMSS